MLLIYDNNNKEKEPLPLAQLFMNLQMVNGQVDNFSQLSFATDNNYSNFEEIRKYFMPNQYQHNNIAGSFTIVDDSEPTKALAYLTGGYVKTIGINTITTVPRVVIDYGNID